VRPHFELLGHLIQQRHTECTASYHHGCLIMKDHGTVFRRDHVAGGAGATPVWRGTKSHRWHRQFGRENACMSRGNDNSGNVERPEGTILKPYDEARMALTVVPVQ
jgi:hypothetical protein